MKKAHGLMLAACAGLAVSSSANAQFTMNDSVPGTWTEIGGTGTPIPITNGSIDDGTGPFTSSVTNGLVTTSALFACTNGFVSNLSTLTTFTNGTLPYTLTGLNLGLFANWDDLYVDAPGAIVHQMVVENGVNVEVVEFSQLRTFTAGTAGPRGSFEIKIFGPGGPALVQYLYQAMDWDWNGNSSTIGVQWSATDAYPYPGLNGNNSNTAGGPLPDNAVLSVVCSGSCTTGACCLGDGSCAQLFQSTCTNQGGVYRGDNSPCATANCPSGACCVSLGCVITGPSGCTAQGGTYHGDGSTCAQSGCPQLWQEQGDAGDVLATAQVVTGSGPLPGIAGNLDANDTDMYQIQVCDFSNFRATTGNVGVTWDTMLWLFDSTGHGVVANDDAVGLQSTITSQFVPANGLYYLAITKYRRIANDSSAQNIWTSFTPEMRPNGPGAGNALDSWIGTTTVGGAYTIAFTGACFVGGNPPPTCYANCDHSTAVPFLNVNDFICFQTHFAGGDSYANCDLSTTPPVLNVNDFICFQTKFAAGCSAP